MPACPHCGAASAPGPACASCGRPLPAEAPAAPADLRPLQLVAGSMLAVGVLVALSGLLLASTASMYGIFAFDGVLFGFAVLLAGAAVIVAASFLLARKGWAWGFAVGVACFGLVYAVAGLARGYSSGFIGLAVWGALGYGLSRDDVRAALDMP